MAELIWRSAIKRTVLAAVVVALCAPIGAIAEDDSRLPDLGDCEEVQVEAGHKVAFQAYAEGVQIYRWNGAKWDFVAPDAVLYSGDGEDSEVVGVHYAGPTWESESGSKVVATVVDRCTPDIDAIPWLLLKSISSEGPGIFHRVSYIQRLYTVGGLAPAAAGDFVGEEAEAPYSALYVFYREQ